MDAEIVQLARDVAARCNFTFSAAQPLGEAPAGEGSSTEGEGLETRISSAVAVFIARSLLDTAAERERPSSKLTLSAILSAYHLSLTEFMKELPAAAKSASPQLSSLLGTEGPLERRLKLRELQSAFVYHTLLHKKLTDLFEAYLEVPAPSRTEVFRFCWLLYVVAKSCLLPAQPDLVSCFNLLLCAISAALEHSPQEWHRGTLVTASSVTDGAPQGSLAYLAAAHKTSLQQLQPMAAAVEELFGSLVTSTEPLGQTAPTKGDNRTTAPFLGVATERAAAIGALDKQYGSLFAAQGDIDERIGVDTGPALATPPSLTKCQVGTPAAPTSTSHVVNPVSPMPNTMRASCILMTPSPRTQNNRGQAMGDTPISTALSATCWLRNLTATLPVGPSSKLQQFFSACDTDVIEPIATRLATLSEAVFPVQLAASAAAFLQPQTEDRRAEAAKLYYRVMEAMLKAEEKRTGRINFTALLSSESFHKGLTALSFEMVIASYRMVSLSFPAVLECLELKAFDLAKLIEPFVRAEPTLPRELQAHLLSIEEQILERLAWERGSSIYPLLATAALASTSAATGEGSGLGTSSDGEGSEGLGSPKGQACQSPVKAAAAAGPSSTSGQLPDGDAGPSASADGSEPWHAQLEQATNPTKRQRDGSPVDASIATANGVAQSTASVGPPADAGRLGPAPGGTSSGLRSPIRCSPQSAFSAFLSPLNNLADGSGINRATSLPSACTVGSEGSAGGALADPAACALLATFLRKVLKLAALRLTDLCDRIDFHPLPRADILAQVYTMVTHVVHDETRLLFGRHLDQILLAALYGAAKVNQLRQVSFKEIIYHYRRQPQARSDIFRNVVILHTQPDLEVQRTGDVIEFYNAVFIPNVKAFLLKIGSGKVPLAKVPSVGLPMGLAPGCRPALAGFMSPASQRTPNGFASPTTFRLGAGKRVFVSPMRSSSLKSPQMTPRTRSLYASAGEASTAYQSPSQDLAAINARLQGWRSPVAGRGPPTSNLHRIGAGRPTAALAAALLPAPAPAGAPDASVEDAALVLHSLDPSHGGSDADDQVANGCFSSKSGSESGSAGFDSRHVKPVGSPRRLFPASVEIGNGADSTALRSPSRARLVTTHQGPRKVAKSAPSASPRKPARTEDAAQATRAFALGIPRSPRQRAKLAAALAGQ